MDKILDFFKKIESKKPFKDFNIGLLLAFFLTGLFGLSFIAVFVGSLLSIFPGFSSSSIGLQDSIHLFFTYLMCFIAFLLICIFYKPLFEYLKDKLKDKDSYIEGIVIAAVTFALAMSYSLISNWLFPHTSNNNQEGLELSFAAQPVLSFFCIVIFAPVCEELTYRLGLFGLLTKKSNIIGYIITILIFAFIHFDFTVFTTGNQKEIINELINLPSYLIGATCLSYGYFRKGNIVTSTVAHSIYNLISFIMMCISSSL